MSGQNLHLQIGQSIHYCLCSSVETAEDYSFLLGHNENFPSSKERRLCTAVDVFRYYIINQKTLCLNALLLSANSH